MWAVIDKNTGMVLACIAGVSYEEAIESANGNTLVEMTLENSPASIGNLWNGKQFVEIGKE
jgi:hypothetical protein